MFPAAILAAVMIALAGCGKEEPASSSQQTIPEEQPALETQEEKPAKEPSAAETSKPEMAIPKPIIGEKPAYYDTMEIMDGFMVFQISSVQDLVELSDFVARGNSTDNGVFSLTKDIDMGGIDFVPIGTVESPFTGRFLGGGHSITNLKVRVEENHPAGFFGVLGGEAHVRELNLEGEVTGISKVGGFVGQLGWLKTDSGQFSTAEIIRSSFKGKVSGVQSDIGGFAGSVSEGSFISQCFAEAEVTGQESLGGFVGTAGQYGLISQCYSRGTVKADLRDNWLAAYNIPEPEENWGTQPSPEQEIMVRYVGGFAGMNVGDIFESYSASEVNTLSEAKTVGGFLGYEAGRDGQCVYLVDNNSQWEPGFAVGDNAEMKVRGFTAEEMALPESYSWDFYFVWDMGQEGLPVFKPAQPMTPGEYVGLYLGGGGG